MMVPEDERLDVQPQQSKRSQINSSGNANILTKVFFMCTVGHCKKNISFYLSFVKRMLRALFFLYLFLAGTVMVFDFRKKVHRMYQFVNN